MLSNSVCNHTRDKQIGPPLRGRQTELHSTQSYYHYLYGRYSISSGWLIIVEAPEYPRHLPPIFGRVPWILNGRTKHFYLNMPEPCVQSRNLNI